MLPLQTEKKYPWLFSRVCCLHTCMGWRLVWRGGNKNKVKLRRAWLVIRLVTIFGGSTIPIIYRPLSLAIPSWAVGSVSAGNGFWHRWRRNSKIAGNMSNKCTFINPNTPQTSRMKMNYSTNTVQVSYFVELPQSNFPDYTTLAKFPNISRFPEIPEKW